MRASHVDMRRADEDGTAPVHIAAARGNLEVLKFLHEHGVDMEASGAIYLSVEGSAQLRTGVTPIMLAHRNLASADQDDASAENDRAQLIVQFLESVAVFALQLTLQSVSVQLCQYRKGQH